ncbi:hypothetical protein HY637_04975 [Candidatus Woesearchaeota archaeon]|nr:hypothetical protein [Candidatus Woesearchaeota archaeon]
MYVAKFVRANRFDLVPRVLDAAVSTASAHGTPVALEDLKKQTLGQLSFEAAFYAWAGDLEGVMSLSTKIRAYAATVGLELPSEDLDYIERTTIERHIESEVDRAERGATFRLSDRKLSVLREQTPLVIDPKIRADLVSRINNLLAIKAK